MTDRDNYRGPAQDYRKPESLHEEPGGIRAGLAKYLRGDNRVPEKSSLYDKQPPDRDPPPSSSAAMRLPRPKDDDFNEDSSRRILTAPQREALARRTQPVGRHVLRSFGIALAAVGAVSIIALHPTATGAVIGASSGTTTILGFALLAAGVGIVMLANRIVR